MAAIALAWRHSLLLRFLLLSVLSIVCIALGLLYFDSNGINNFCFNSNDYVRKMNFALEQNGDYWLVNNFIKAKNPQMKHNKSITLTTHGTYKDFKNLEWLAVRWHAPISLTLFANADDFDQTLISLYHLKYCTRAGATFFRWVSVHLVFHMEHFPRNFQAMSQKKPFDYYCNFVEPYAYDNQNDTYWYRYNLTYPNNFLRNVARQNVESYYIFALDATLLPTLNFNSYFMRFAKHYVPREAEKSVYCVPIYPQLHEEDIPKYKSELLSQFYPYYAAHTINTLPLNDTIDKMREWIFREVQDGHLSVYSVTQYPASMCQAYVSVNIQEPLYDQRYVESMYDFNSIRLNLLTKLHFDFIILDGVFLIMRKTDTWRGLSQPPSIDAELRRAAIMEFTKLYTLQLWYTNTD